jgi:hypothetical protein
MLKIIIVMNLVCSTLVWKIWVRLQPKNRLRLSSNGIYQFIILEALS